jgi:hypothetical protein
LSLANPDDKLKEALNKFDELVFLGLKAFVISVSGYFLFPVTALSDD